MRKIINIIVALLIVGIGVGYLVLGPSVVLGGPSKAEITRVTREVMEQTATSSDESAIAKAATITPQGLCSKTDDGVFACMVEITAEGRAPQTLIAELKKSAEGVWGAAQ